ncbi:MAG: YidC/Oxa1 family membrane protein insertase [Candidatus Liptonbacteria bacterium]|nr:YidC/Oxa1 family membrane protein insertase [Candidatus Liptonbacteria bacterium]
MYYLFEKILYQPLLNLLILTYQTVGFQDLGLAIILVTIFIRLLLYPFSQANLRQQKIIKQIQPELKKIQSQANLRQQKIIKQVQPELKKIQEKYKDNKEKQAKELFSLYKKNKINPFSSFVFIIIQLPILIALYTVLVEGFNNGLGADLYSFISAPDEINHFFLNLINLREPNNIIIGLTVLTQYIQVKLSPSLSGGIQGDNAQEKAKQVEKITSLIMPAITLFFLLNLPSAIAVYWLTTTVFSIIQQLIVNKSK